MKSATPEIDGLAQARHAMAQGESPLQIRQYFKSFKQAVAFYASVRGTEYGTTRVGENCCSCGAADTPHHVELVWFTEFANVSAVGVGYIIISLLFSMLGHLHVHTKKDVIAFSTFHVFCERCWPRILQRRLLGITLGIASGLSIFASAIAATYFAVAIAVTDNLAPQERAHLCFSVAASLGILAVSSFIRLRYRALGLPVSLKHIAPRPFRLGRMVVMRAVPVPGQPGQVVQVPRYTPSRDMSWQQAVGLVVALFIGIPAAVIICARDSSTFYRNWGYGLLAGCAALLVILTVWHIRSKRRIVARYYEQSAAILASSSRTE